MFSFAVVVVRKLVVVPVLATLLSSVGTELSICALSGEALSPPKKFGLDLQLATEGKEAGSSTAEESEGAASEVWHQKVRDLAGGSFRKLGTPADFKENSNEALASCRGSGTRVP